MVKRKKKDVFNSRCMLVWPYHRTSTQVPQYRYCSVYSYIADRRPTSATPALPGPPVTFLQTRMTLTNGDNSHPEGSLFMDSHAELWKKKIPHDRPTAWQRDNTCDLVWLYTIEPTGSIMNTRQVTRAPRLSLSRNAIMNFQTGKRYKTIRHCWFLHTLYKRIGYVIIHKPHFQGVNVWTIVVAVLTCCFRRVGSICRCNDH